MGELPNWVGMTVHDTTDPDHPIEIFSRRCTGTPLDSMGSLHEIQFAGRKWELRFVPDKARVIASRMPPPSVILAAGLVVTALVGFLFGNLSIHAARSRTAENETREALSAVEAAFEEAALLGKITEKINAGLGISEILDFVYKGFESVIPYERIGLALVDEDGETVRSRWVRSRRGSISLGDGYCTPLEGSSLKKVLESGKPRILDDLQSYVMDHPDSTSSHLIVKDGMRSSLTCPLVVRGKAVGFLFFSSATPSIYNSGHSDTLMRVTSQISIIVEKGRLFDALAEEERRSEQILSSLLPPEILVRVRNGEEVIADEVPSVSVVFADLVNFSGWPVMLVHRKWSSF